MQVNVVGAGAWGTALGAIAAADESPVTLWAREPQVAGEINQAHTNSVFLPGVSLPSSLRATCRLEDVARADAILLVTPAQHLREAAARLAPHIAPSTILIICAKGIERGTDALLSDALREAAPGAVPAVLSGPSFAGEVARGSPTAITLAIADPRGPELLQRLGRATFRPYLSDDLIGAQIGGAVKNVLAIACGIVEGKGLGQSARAALITRGFAEMSRFAVRLGARAETLGGLSGLGDLVLTCTSTQSRNYSLGVALGRGETLDHALAAHNGIAEGAFTAAALKERAALVGVEMPISQAVDGVLTGALTVDDAIQGLLTRPFTAENTTPPRV